MSAHTADAASNGAPGGTAANSGGATGGKAFGGKLTRRGALTLAPAAMLAAACTSNKKTTSGATTGTNRSLDSVTYMTAFGTFGREGYVYVADAKGFFRDNGIEVKIVAGNGQPQNLQALVNNQHQFMSQDSSQALILMSKGLKDVRFIGAIHQRTVIALMALAASGITRPQDLQGKTIGYGGQAPFLLYPAYARLAGFDPKATTWKPVTPQQLPALLAQKKVDAIGQFVTGTPLIKAVAKQDVVVLPYSDFLADLYGNVLVTNETMLKTKPDLVHRFNKALMKGLAYSVANPEESGTLINKAISTTPAAVATAELKVMQPYVNINGTAVGALDQSRVSRAIALMTSIGVVQQGTLSPESVVDFGFVPKA
jgi:NitT/TauT family transport system substrate-binding protein